MHIYIVEFFSLCLLLLLKNVLGTYNAYIHHVLSELSCETIDLRSLNR